VTSPRILPFGESAYLVELGDTFDEAIVDRARAIADLWSFGDAIPAYASVVLEFDPALVAAADAERRIAELLSGMARARVQTGRVVEIPTRYDGPDLADVAAMSKISVEELVALHSGREYTAYFLGFLPGWAYCGRLDPRIVATRLERPRERVPAGSVGVVDGQTGVYPHRSPGGWRLIGSTDAVMFDAAREPASLLRAGDRVRFVQR
jgi:KipI family sensor histidine kinase inhibitor